MVIQPATRRHVARHASGGHNAHAGGPGPLQSREALLFGTCLLTVLAVCVGSHLPSSAQLSNLSEVVLYVAGVTSAVFYARYRAAVAAGAKNREDAADRTG